MNYAKITFFGSSDFSVYVLDELKFHHIYPNLIITTPDKPKGRKLVITPTPVKVWAQNNSVEVLDPVSLKDNPNLISHFASRDPDLFLVASYGKIIPKEIFEIPKHKTLNIHPSLLPKYRGASPIQSQILKNEKDIGVTIIQIDEGMDTGPIVAQKPLRKILEKNLAEQCDKQFKQCLGKSFFEQLSRKNFEEFLAIEGARLFVHVLPEWTIKAIDPIMQNEKEATYCQKIKKEDGLIDLDDDPYKNLLKIRAFEEWPTAYYFKNKRRIIIIDAKVENNELKILRVKPEGKKEMSYEDFLRGQR